MLYRRSVNMTRAKTVKNYIWQTVNRREERFNMIAKIYAEKSTQLRYPSEDPKKIEEIEDMAGKKNREDARENYRNEIRAERNKYGEEQYKIDKEFKLALFKEYGVETNPKREKAFSMAWERGHSYGYGEVEGEFMDLVELLKED